MKRKAKKGKATQRKAIQEKAKPPFDPKVFLAKVNGGRSISNYRKNQIVFTQGASADAVFYIQSGKAKKTVISEQGKEAVAPRPEMDRFSPTVDICGMLRRGRKRPRESAKRIERVSVGGLGLITIVMTPSEY